MQREDRQRAGRGRESAPRAFLHLSEGNEIAAEEPSLARKAVVVLLMGLFVAAVPLLWANSAQGDEQATRPSAVASSDDGSGGAGGDGDDDDSTASVAGSDATTGTGSRDSALTTGPTKGATNDSTDDKGSARTAGTGQRDSNRTAGTTNPSTGLKTDDSNSAKTRGTGSRDSARTAGTTRATRG